MLHRGTVSQITKKKKETKKQNKTKTKTNRQILVQTDLWGEKTKTKTQNDPVMVMHTSNYFVVFGFRRRGRDKVLVSSPGCPGTRSVDQTVPASRVLRLKEQATKARFFVLCLFVCFESEFYLSLENAGITGFLNTPQFHPSRP